MKTNIEIWSAIRGCEDLAPGHWSDETTLRGQVWLLISNAEDNATDSQQIMIYGDQGNEEEWCGLALASLDSYASEEVRKHIETHTGHVW